MPRTASPGPDEKVHAYDYQVPALHTRATRDESFRWDFFVKHYTDEARQKLDSKYVEKQNGHLVSPRRAPSAAAPRTTP